MIINYLKHLFGKVNDYHTKRNGNKCDIQVDWARIGAAILWGYAATFATIILLGLARAMLG